MKNWKTTLAGLGFAASFLTFVIGTQFPPLQPYMPWIGFAAACFGFIRDYWSKDKDVTGV